MKAYVRDILLPAARAIRARVCPPAPAPAQPVPDTGDSAPPAAQADPKPKSVFTIDGEHDQLEAFLALFMEEFDSIPDADEFELVKFAAACSKTQQPADVSPCFFVLKQLVEKMAVSEEAPIAERYMPAVIDALRPLPAAEFGKYKNFLSHLLVLLSAAFTRKNVQSGWINTGLFPLNTLQILTKCTTFPEYTDDEIQAMVTAVKSLAVVVAENGELTDKEIAGAMKGKVNFVAVGRATLEKQSKGSSTKTPLHQLTLNRRRAVLLSHKKIQEQRKPPAAAPGPQQPADGAPSSNKDGGRRRGRPAKSRADDAEENEARRKKKKANSASTAAPARLQPRRGVRDGADARALQMQLVDDDCSTSGADDSD